MQYTLKQAKLDGIKVFELLDTLKSLDKLQLSFTVATVLNFNRQKVSTLGFRVEILKLLRSKKHYGVTNGRWAQGKFTLNILKNM